MMDFQKSRSKFMKIFTFKFNHLIFSTLLLLLSHSQTSLAADKEVEQLKSELEQLKQNYSKKIQLLEERLDELESANDDAVEATEELAIEVSQQSNQQSASSFNPGIGVILNGKLLSQNPNDFEFSLPGFFQAGEIGPGESGLAVGETELNLSANIDDKFYGSVTLAFGDGTAAVEEAYLQSIALPYGLGLKAGRFFSSIGYLSGRHTHTDDFSERPLPYEAFLGGQFGDDGIQLSWLASTDMFWESGIEIFRGDSFPASGAAHRGIGSWSAFTHIGGDIDDSRSWRAGVSILNSNAIERNSNIGETFTGDSDLTVFDFVWKWAPNGNATVTNAKIQAEYLNRKESGDFTPISGLTNNYQADQNGWYLQGIYQFMPQWRVGLRYSALQADDLNSTFAGTVLDNQGIDPSRSSLMFDWSNSEFSRIRLQYSNDQSSTVDADIWTLQYIAAFGAHGAHSF
jgi:hypothetical protein